MKDYIELGVFILEMREKMMSVGMDFCIDKKICRICEKLFSSEFFMYLYMI